MGWLIRDPRQVNALHAECCLLMHSRSSEPLNLPKIIVNAFGHALSAQSILLGLLTAGSRVSRALVSIVRADSPLFN
jgi:hypothetical protein